MWMLEMVRADLQMFVAWHKTLYVIRSMGVCTDTKLVQESRINDRRVQ